jgi:hypothetical protein
MFAGSVLPSWFEIEDRLITEVESRGFGNFRSSLNETVMSVGLVLRRVENIRTAFYRADHEAAELLRQRFADIDIADVLNELLSAVSQMAMIVAGSVLTGGAIGAGVGALAGGAGAVPGAFTGIAIGLQAGTWMLGVLGLASVAEFFVDGLAPLIEHYLRGIETAWEGTRGDEGLSPFSQDDFLVVERASHHFARGHVEVVVLLLSAIVDYLTRGRGHAGQLAKEMRASGKGQHLGQWMLKHEEGLKNRPDLQPRAPGKGPLTPQEPPPGPQRQHEQNDQQHRKNSLGMPEYKVPCFNASNMHYSKVPEFDRQLGGQERGLNDLTVDEYLRGREAFKAGDVVRDPKVARSARNRTTMKFKNDYFADLIAKNYPAEKAERMARDKAVKKMSTLAALHNPDLIAGGKDFIGDFGDKQINASIGPQWRNRILGLDIAVKTVPEKLRKSTRLSVKLHRCGRL